MIGGTLSRNGQVERERLFPFEPDGALDAIPLEGYGTFFASNAWRKNRCLHCTDDGLVILSEDMLVGEMPDHRLGVLDPAEAFVPQFVRNGPAAAFDSVVSDYRMAAWDGRPEHGKLYLVSNRAGAGRIYYHRGGDGLLFCSDLRAMCRWLRFEIDPMGLYALVKYGAVPEPLTIHRCISAVPPAHYLEYDPRNGRVRIEPYFRLAFEQDTDGEGRRVDRGLLAASERALRASAGFLAGFDPTILVSGGVDSSLYACYLGEALAGKSPPRGVFCTFGADDPERPYAEQLARRAGVTMHVAAMRDADALEVLDRAVGLSDHPFGDFSSLPVTFLLSRIGRQPERYGSMLIECNGGDDCFGFPALAEKNKYRIKHAVPPNLKRLMARGLAFSPCWKWASHEGLAARVAALVDVHEVDPLSYFLVQPPVHFIGLPRAPDWDRHLAATMGRCFSRAVQNPETLPYEALTTVRQLLHINSRQWTAKALSVGESLGIRVIYPYIWRNVLVEQGRMPWTAKSHNGIVKWPLKKLLEDYMPPSFIHRQKVGFVPPFARWLTAGNFNRALRDVLLDRGSHVGNLVPRARIEELLADALDGRRLRYPILNFLWNAAFTELWIGRHGTGDLAPATEKKGWDP